MPQEAGTSTGRGHDTFPGGARQPVDRYTLDEIGEAIAALQDHDPVQDAIEQYHEDTYPVETYYSPEFIEQIEKEQGKIAGALGWDRTDKKPD